MGSLAIGREPFVISIGARGIEGRVEYSVLCLFVASILWTMIYDTLYAHQDLEDDLKVGVKSMAVLYRGRTKPVLWLLVSLMCASMISYGQLSGMGVSYYLVAMSGAIGTLSVMIARVDLKSSESCWWWFSNAFWFAGGSISAGLGAEYLGRILQ